MSRGFCARDGAFVETDVGESTLGERDLEIAVEAAAVGEPELAVTTSAVVLGGACVGTVVRTGSACSELEGARVAVGPIDFCGECWTCRRGHPALCVDGRVRGETAHGALATHTVARAESVCRLDGDLAIAGPQAAILAREAGDAYGLLARAGVAAGEIVLVLGTGPTAALVDQIALARGARSHRLRDASDELPREIAESARARHILAVRSDALERVAALATPGSTIGVLAAPAPTGALSASLLAIECQLFGLRAVHPDLIPELAAMVVKGEIDLSTAIELSERADAGQLRARARQADARDRALVISPG